MNSRRPGPGCGPDHFARRGRVLPVGVRARLLAASELCTVNATASPRYRSSDHSTGTPGLIGGVPAFAQQRHPRADAEQARVGRGGGHGVDDVFGVREDHAEFLQPVGDRRDIVLHTRRRARPPGPGTRTVRSSPACRRVTAPAPGSRPERRPPGSAVRTPPGWPPAAACATIRPEGVSPRDRAHREKLTRSVKFCSFRPPRTTRRAPRRDAITPSARSAANACRTVPRDTPYSRARSLSEGNRAPSPYTPSAIAVFEISGEFLVQRRSRLISFGVHDGKP